MNARNIFLLGSYLFFVGYAMSQGKQDRVQGYFSEMDSILNTANHNPLCRSLSEKQQVRLEELMEKITKKEKLTFRSELYRYLISRYDTRSFSHLLQAAMIDPKNKTVLRELAIYYWLTMDMDRIQIAFKEIRENGVLTEEYCLYGADLLESVPLNGMLLTHGFSDSFGCIYEQVIHGKRGDVFVVSLDLLQSGAYRDQLLKKGIRLPATAAIDTQYVAEFIRLNSNREITCSLTLPIGYFKGITAKKYVTGLGITISSDPQFDNYFYNNYAWNEAFSKAILGISTEQSILLAANYLPMLLELRMVETQLGGEITELDSEITRIAEKTGKLDLVHLLLKN